MNPQVFESELFAVRRNRKLLGLAASPFVAGLGLILAGSLGTPILFAFIPHAIVLGVVAMAYAWRKNFRPRIEACHVRADGDGVTLGGRLLARHEIRAGFVAPGANAPRVHLRRRRGLPVELQAGSVEEARGLLRALGLDVSQTVAEFRTPSRALARRRYFAGAGLVLGVCFSAYGSLMGLLAHAAGGLTTLVMVLPFVALAALAAAPSRLRIGADGFEVRWLWTRRFVRYEEVGGFFRYVKGWGNSRTVGLRVALRSGEELLLPIHRGTWDSQQCAFIEERLREAKEEFRAGDLASDAALLTRGERSVRDWLMSLRAVGSGANVTLRTAPVPKDRLLRIVEDPAQAADARAAAAVALGPELDEPGRARLRLAAEAIAAPKLRVAIEKAVDRADDAEVEAALAELEADARRARSA